MIEEIKKEIYEYLDTQDLSEDELKIIDSYVLEIINYFKPIVDLSDELKDVEKTKELASLILKDMGAEIG